MLWQSVLGYLDDNAVMVWNIPSSCPAAYMADGEGRGSGGFPLESCAARICRDLDLHPGPRADNRRLERFASVPRRTTCRGHHDGQHSPQEAVCGTGRSRPGPSPPERTHEQGRARLVVFACETGGRWSEEAQSFLRHLARARARQNPERCALR